MAASRDAVVAVVCGGPAAEAEVSRISASGVASALAATFDRTVVLELDSAIGEQLRTRGVDVVFPVLHGPPGEDGTFQGFLEVLGIPYVGSGVHASACGMDKIVSKHLFRGAGLPVARDATVHRNEDLERATVRVMEQLGSRVVVKPSRQGSALGVEFASDRRQLASALRTALSFDEWLLCEERIHGKEITVGLLERDGLEALPTIEVRTPEGTWYDYEHRYTQGLSKHLMPPGISEAQDRAAREIARQAHRALGCRDLSRVDFVVPEEGVPVLLEVNTLPGMTPTSLYPDAAAAAGLSFEALAAHLVERALNRSGASGAS
jgi:D-alanine-D-alanine ligase